MSYQPITWRTIQSDVAGATRAATDAMNSGAQQLNSALNTFGQINTDMINRRETGHMADFDSALQGFTNPGDLQAQRASLMDRIGQYGTSPEQQMKMRQALDSRISGLQSQNKNQWEYDNALAKQNAMPAMQQVEAAIANRDAAGAQRLMEQHKDVLSPFMSDLQTKLNPVQDANALSNIISGNQYGASSNSIAGLDKDSQTLLDKQRRGESLTPDETNALKQAVTSVQHLNTPEAIAERDRSAIMHRTRFMSPAQQQQALADYEADMQAKLSRPATVQAQLTQYETKTGEELEIGKNMYANASKTGGNPPTWQAVKEIASRHGKDFEQDQAAMITNWLTERSNRGIEVDRMGPDGKVMRDANGSPLKDRIPIPVDENMIQWAASQYNNEWLATDASRSKLEKEFIKNFDPEGQFRRNEEYKKRVKDHTAALDKQYGFDPRTEAQRLGAQLYNTAAAPQTQAQAPAVQQQPVAAPTPVATTPAPANDFVGGLQNIINAGKQLPADSDPRTRALLQSQVTAANRALAAMEKPQADLTKMTGLGGDGLANLRAEYARSGEIRMDGDLSKLQQNRIKKRLDELISIEERARKQIDAAKLN